MCSDLCRERETRGAAAFCGYKTAIGGAGDFRGLRWADTGRGKHDSRARLPECGERRPEGRKCLSRSMTAGGPV